MPLFLALGLSNVLSSTYLNKATFDKGDPAPTVWGQDLRNVGMVAGLALALFGTPLLSAIGIGAAVASYVNKDSTARVQGMVQKQIGEFRAELDKKLKEAGLNPDPALPLDPQKQIPGPPQGIKVVPPPPAPPGAGQASRIPNFLRQLPLDIPADPAPANNNNAAQQFANLYSLSV